MWIKKNYVTESQLNHIANMINNRINNIAGGCDADLLKYYRKTVQRHSEEINFLLKVISEAGLIKEINSETDNSVVEYLGTKWKIKKVK